jgi:predicted acylesterase/phospholipase RssA
MKPENDLTIALAFSGGGFRASAFSLGVLAYLDHIRDGDAALLESVRILSTVSGGTITGARYAVGLKRGESVDEIYHSLYKFMTEVDVVALSLDRLTTKKGWPLGRSRSLINVFSDLYDQYLMNGERFGLILDEQKPVHLKHIAFNATEFADNGTQFRFQATEKIERPIDPKYDHGLIGNFFYQIPPDLAGHIRMGDIIAASSCFPAGFEPIIFPDDFILTEDIVGQLKSNNLPSVGLMDGGIVDNQGIESVLLAEARISQNLLGAELPSSGRNNTVDLVILVDVDSPFMEPFKPSHKRSNFLFRFLTPQYIDIIIKFLLPVSIFVLIYMAWHRWVGDVIFLAFLSTMFLALFGIVVYLKRFLGKLSMPDLFRKPIGKFGKIQLAVFENMIMNRVNSVMKMTVDVFMKQVRRLQYKLVYENDFWKNRRIMHAIYELTEKNIRNRKIPISPDLMPSEAIKSAARSASEMATTLWFTGELHEKKQMLDTIIAAGQFGLCWNLIEYIDGLKIDHSNTSPFRDRLMACENQLRADWQKFQQDPYWMVKAYSNTQKG